jgi:ribosomally synthesized peptide (two-chain TOMM family)
MSDNQAPFPRLRAAYLRSIAEVWNDPRFLEVLVHESNSNPRGALPFLERRYNFEFPFNVAFKISDKRRPLYRPIGTTGWFGMGDEFEVYLPAMPQNPAEGAAVLARYCAEFPSLLGGGTVTGVAAPADFSNFGTVTSQVLALAWHNKTFHSAIYRADDARQLIQDTMNWIVPWNFFIKFKEVPGPGSTADEYWASFPRSIITVHMPMKPDKESLHRNEVDHTVEAVALAAYNGTGSQYPFTCP